MKKKIKWEAKRLPLSVLKVHPSVQREFDIAHGQDIAKSWQSLVARPAIVIQMTSGDRGFYIIDGQHTRWAAEKVGELFLDCRIIRAKTKAEMNEIFHLVNAGVKHISPIDSYGMNSRNDSRTPDALSHQILKECNLTVGKGGGNHCIRAVQPVRKAFAQLGMEKFGTAAALWEVIADAGSPIKAETVVAVADIVARHGGDQYAIEDLAELFASDFGQVHADAVSRCVGVSLAAAPNILVEEIESRAFGYSYRGKRKKVA